MIPHLIDEDNISLAWLNAVSYILTQKNAECNNLIVHIKNPRILDQDINLLYENFCIQNDLTNQYKVATFVFPQRLYEILNGDKERLFRKQKRIHVKVKGRWGSYFDQMVEWKESNGRVKNQLKFIIDKLNERNRVHKAAYTIQITNPILHFSHIRGGPCLHYILLQLQSTPRKMDLLAVYRNHDFAMKAYGNYLGLGNLLKFIASETDFELGSITCVSSHAYIDGKFRKILRNIVNEATHE